MAADYHILEEELKNLSSQLKRDLHMMEVRKLARKHYGLSKKATQKKRINQLYKQVAEIEPTVSRLYSAQHFLKDNQIKGYLIYLLQMKEYFTREVKTKMEIIHKREEQIKHLVVKLCEMRNEYSKKLRSLPSKSSEFIRLENMSNRMNQIEKRICTLQAENKELRENILNMQMFQHRYKDFEREFRSKIGLMTSAVQMHLDNAVSIYEEREDFVNRSKIYQDRFSQDLRKAALNENSLNLILEKTKKYEDFEKLQNQERTDSRIVVTGDLIKKGITGLEPTLKTKEDLYLEIAKASEQSTPKDMKEYFKLTEDKSVSMFSYLEDVMEEINHTQSIVDELKVKNRNLLKSMSTSERKLRWEIKENQARAGLLTTEAEIAEIYRNQAQEELNDLLEYLWKMYQHCGLDISKFEEGVNDCNAEAVKEKVEKQIIQYLLYIEYIRMQQFSSVNDDAVSIIEEDLSVIVETLPEDELADTLQPRELESETQLSSLFEVEHIKLVLPMERLKVMSTAAVAELESENEERKSI